MPRAKTNKQTHVENLKHATKVARNSLFILFGLMMVKAFGGYVTNVVALFGDALGSFSDLIASSAILVGLVVSQKQASKTFKYGYHRVETFTTFLISAFIIYAGYKLFLVSLNRFFVTNQTSFHIVGIIAALISIIVSYFIYKNQYKTAKSINSTALLASAYDKRNDMFVSFGVLCGVVADKFGIPYVEGSVGILISAIVIFTGIKHGKEAIFYLLDYWDDPVLTKKIRSILEKSKIVTFVKNIRLRHAGTYVFGEAFLEINPFTDSKDLRDEIRRLNAEIEKNIEHVGDIVLYINPPKPTVARVAIPISIENGLASEIAEDPLKPFRLFFVEIRDGAIQNSYAKEETFTVNQISQIARFLKEQKTNILISSMIRPLLYYNLRLNNIKVYPHFLGVRDVKNTVKLLMLDI